MRARREGFTLIEALVVVGLIALLAAALVPRLSGGSARNIKSAATVLAAELTYTGQRAAASGRLHRFAVDLDEQRFRIEVQRVEDNWEAQPASKLPTHADLLELTPPPADIEYEEIQEPSGEWRPLEVPVTIAAVTIGDDEHVQGLVGVTFAGGGGADPAEILLEDENGFRTALRVLPFTGEVRTVEEPSP